MKSMWNKMNRQQKHPLRSLDAPRVKATAPINPYKPPILFSQRLKKHKLDQQYTNFLEVFKKLYMNISFTDALIQMHSYVKFLKDVQSNKHKVEEHETIMLTMSVVPESKKKLPPN